MIKFSFMVDVERKGAVVSNARIVLRSDREPIELRQLVPADSSDLFSLFDSNRSFIRNFMPGLNELVSSESELRKWINRAERSPRIKTFGIWDGEELVGQQTLYPKKNRSGEIETWVGKQFAGRNLAVRTMEILKRFAFDQVGLDKLIGYVFVDNDAGIRLLESTGFTRREGVVSDQYVYLLPNPHQSVNK